MRRRVQVVVPRRIEVLREEGVLKQDATRNARSRNAKTGIVLCITAQYIPVSSHDAVMHQKRTVLPHRSNKVPEWRPSWLSLSTFDNGVREVAGENGEST